jgi:hypothetical protein
MTVIAMSRTEIDRMHVLRDITAGRKLGDSTLVFCVRFVAPGAPNLTGGP